MLEDKNARETPEAGRDCEQAASGGSASISGKDSCGSHPIDRGYGSNIHRWHKEFGGLQLDQVKRLKEPENENGRLRRSVSDLTLDKMILAEAAKGNVWSAPSMQGFLD